jgi:hypothetical protein
LRRRRIGNKKNLPAIAPAGFLNVYSFRDETAALTKTITKSKSSASTDCFERQSGEHDEKPNNGGAANRRFSALVC